MSLLELAEDDLSAFESYNIQQIVGICGDGRLLDGSDCSAQLRRYLSLQSNEKLAEYANFCLDSAFNKSGLVLQDIINEIGRRLGYGVTDGRYSGTSNAIGFDGLWKGTNAALIVEVKTSDAYRINLDNIIRYARRVDEEGLVDVEPSVLLVVGRQDTGDMEAQVRGSRHAWQIRLVSIESLTKLMSVRSDISEATFIGKVRQILLPFEYTRVDHIIDLVFETQREVEEKITDIDPVEDEISVANDVSSGGNKWDFTPTAEIDEKRNQLLSRFYNSDKGGVRRVTRAQYLSDSSNVRVACSISKRYSRDHQPYWYAFHPSWLAFLSEGSEAFFVLGCMDRMEGYAIPLSEIKANLDNLNRTEKKDRHYWHIALSEDDEGLFVNLPRIGGKLYIQPFAF